MVTKTLPEAVIEPLSKDEGETVRLNYRCRTCGKVFQTYGYPEVKRDFYQGGLVEKVLHDCREGKLYLGVTGIADLIGWEKAD